MSFFNSKKSASELDAEQAEKQQKAVVYQQRLDAHAQEVKGLEVQYVTEMTLAVTAIQEMVDAISMDNCLLRRQALLKELRKWRNFKDSRYSNAKVFFQHHFPMPPFNPDLWAPPSTWEHIVLSDSDYAKAAENLLGVLKSAEGVLQSSYGVIAKHWTVTSEEMDENSREVVLIQHTMAGTIRKYWVTLNGVQSVSVVFVPHYQTKG